MNINQLKIGCAAFLLTLCGCVATDTERSTGEAVDDSTLAVRAKSALIENKTTAAHNIDIEVFKGEVQLNGFVDSAHEKTTAGDVVRKIDGVKQVHNNLQVQASRSSGEVVDDTVISTKVKAALIGDSRTKGFQIEVSTSKGTVQLGGFVDSSAAKAAAAEVAAGIPGVKSVSNGLIVKG